MAKEGLEWFEAALGAVSKITNGDDGGGGLEGARCPKCEAADFVKVSDQYAISVGRLEEQGDGSETIREGGMTDLQMAQRFTPPRRTSALGVGFVLGALLSAIAYYVYRRFGEVPGQISFGVALVVTAGVLMTTLRSFSDRYYERRQQWNRLYMCRKCGQLVRS